MDNPDFTEHFMSNMLHKDISLYYCGHEKCSPGHSYGTAMRSHYLLHYVTGGKGSFSTPDHKYTLQEGESFCMFPHTPASYIADRLEPWEYYWVGFDGEWVGSYLGLANITEDSPIHTRDHSGAVRRLFAELLYHTRSNEIASEAYCTGLLFQLFAAYMNQATAADNTLHHPANNSKDWSIRQAVQFIRANYQRKLTVSMLAAHVGLERAYFTKRFHESMGASPYEFIIQYRMEQALRLLMHTDQPIGTIAYSTGFEDPSYFSKIFTQRNGCPPSAFRRKQATSGTEL